MQYKFITIIPDSGTIMTQGLIFLNRRIRKSGNLTSTLYTGPISILNGHFSLMEFSSSAALLKDKKRRYISLSSVNENSLRLT